MTLQIGSLGAFTLVAIGAAILALERGAPLPAGLLLSLTMLKPSQGAPIALLAGIWLIARHEWKGLWGMFAGGVALLALGAAADPLWMIQFGSSSQTLLKETLGLQSNAISFAYLACRHNSSCTWLLGGLGVSRNLGALRCLFMAWTVRPHAGGSLQPHHPRSFHLDHLFVVLRPDSLCHTDCLDFDCFA